MTAAKGEALILYFDEYRAGAERLSRTASLPALPIEVHRFPDGESRVRLPAELPERVVLVRSLDRPDGKLVELMLAAEAARELGAGSLTLVAPYLCYMRQDAAFRPGEAVSQRIVGRFLARLFDRLVTVDPHLHRIDDLGEVVPETETCVLSATTPMAEFLEGRFENPVLVGPDAESEQWVAALARLGGLEHVVATKERRGDADVRVTLPEHAFSDRDVVLVDDVASTGRSLAATAQAVRASAPRSVSALVTHGLFAGDAMEVLEAAGIDAVWSTDSIPGPTSRITLDRLIAEVL